ncbi:hypothetical protein ABZ784_29415 [Streptomyces tendae]|uniref:hypothetical protein n=1 Tax=Streptomyces tendae TaxID=1932 RepID=UPI0033CC6C93
MTIAKTKSVDSAESQAAGSGLQTAVTVFGMTLFTMVVGAALYGTPEQSERAFRLLPWLRPHPETTSDEHDSRSGRR